MKKNIFFLFLFASILANAQKFTVKGTVYDENKTPLEGATLLVKETNKGISTDKKGNFSLSDTLPEIMDYVRLQNPDIKIFISTT